MKWLFLYTGFQNSSEVKEMECYAIAMDKDIIELIPREFSSDKDILELINKVENRRKNCAKTKKKRQLEEKK